jgi:hypothetical protein
MAEERPTLVVPRPEAEERLAARIKSGKRLLRRIPARLDDEQIERVESEFRTWDEENIAQLEGLSSTSALRDAYDTPLELSYGEDPYHKSWVYKERVRACVSRLESLKERLAIMDAPAAPVGATQGLPRPWSPQERSVEGGPSGQVRSRAKRIGVSPLRSGGNVAQASRIYISAPADSNLSQEQLDIKSSILGAIENERFEPQEFLGSGIPQRMAWSFERAELVMSRCQGAAILAFARWVAVPAKEQRPAPSVHLPSEYNHFEGALAFARRLPLLVITDARVRTGGITLLSDGPVIFWPEGVGPAGTSEAWFRGQFDSWVDEVRSRPHVFLGYCSSARSTASELTLFMERELGLRVKNYAMDFSAGPTIFEQIEAAARDCTCGIFLFTKDDPLEGQEGAAPRDNVVFEAGYFFRAKGKDRIAVIREGGAKVPADLGGNIYIALKDRSDIAPIHSQLRRFLENAL